MREFQFLAKQGQHNDIARLLTSEFGKPRLAPYNGERGQGVMVTLALPSGVSKRQVDRFLFSRQIPGAVRRRNRFRIFNYDSWFWRLWELTEQVGSAVFIMVQDGRMRKAQVVTHYPGCDCCGPWNEIEFL